MLTFLLILAKLSFNVNLSILGMSDNEKSHMYKNNSLGKK